MVDVFKGLHGSEDELHQSREKETKKTKAKKKKERERENAAPLCHPFGFMERNACELRRVCVSDRSPEWENRIMQREAVE